MESEAGAMLIASVGRDLDSFCKTLGVELRSVSGPFDIDVESLSDFDRLVSLERFCNLLEVLAIATRKDTFGLEYAKYFRPGATGLIGQGLRATATLADTLLFFQRYHPLYADFHHIDLAINSDTATYEMAFSPKIRGQEHLLDFTFSVFIRTLREVSDNKIRIKEIALQRDPPANTSLIKNHFSAPASFLQPMNKIVIHADTLAARNPGSNPVAYEFIQQQCDHKIATRRYTKTFLERVQDAFAAHIENGRYPIARMATDFGMSVRTMQRRLAEKTTTYEALFLETRRELMLEKLSDPLLRYIDISISLGFSAQASFNRAVKEAFGDTPGAIRRKILADSSGTYRDSLMDARHAAQKH